MRERKRKYEDRSGVEFLLLRDKLGFKRYRKRKKRDVEERRILTELGLKKIRESEEEDFIPTGFRKRRLKV